MSGWLWWAYAAAGTAGWLALAPRASAVRLGAVSASAAKERRTGRVGWIGLALAVVLSTAGLMGGPRALAVSLSVTILTGCVIRLAVLRRRAARALRDQAEVARACRVLGSELRLGHVPMRALAAAAEDCPVLQEASAVGHIGGDVVELWRNSSTRPGQQGLLALARAWQVTGSTGAPVAPSLATVAEALREQQELDHLVAGELASPRMTSRLLAVLPLFGLGLGYLVGGDPLAFLLGSPYGQVCLVAGAGLIAAGLLWSEHIAGQAARS